MIAPKISEDSELITVFQFIDLMANSDPRYEAIFHVANERKCSYITGRILKKKGVRAGVPDIIIPIASSGYHGLWIELKVKPNRLTPDQSRFIDLLIALGHCARVCWSATEAIELIKEYIKGAGEGRPANGSFTRLGSLGVSAPRAKKPRLQ